MPKCIGCSNTDDFETLRDLGSETPLAFELQRCERCGLRYVQILAARQEPTTYWLPVTETDVEALLESFSEAAVLELLQGRPYLVRTPDGKVQRTENGRMCEALRR